DEYVLDGQKIWTSTAHIADWGLFLVRTDPTALERGAKHEGITALIVDMHLPGIEVRPIPDIIREEMFCEVFFTDSRVPAEFQLAKLQWSFLSQTLAELAVDLLGPAGVLEKGGPDAVDGGAWARNYVWQRYTSIGAGTTEVQKNIIADRAIQLPRK